jgi:hypothetical protein
MSTKCVKGSVQEGESVALSLQNQHTEQDTHSWTESGSRLMYQLRVYDNYMTVEISLPSLLVITP